MADRPLAMADGQRLPESLLDINPSGRNRRRHGLALGKSCCDGRGQGASRSMAVGRLNPSAIQPVDVSVVEEIATFKGRIAAGLDQNRFSALGMNHSGMPE